MSARSVGLAAVAVVLLGSGGYGLYRLGVVQGAASVAAAGGASRAVAGNAAATTSRQAALPDKNADRKVLYWHDPMVPGQRFDKPGKSPFMDMQLVPVYADSAGDAGGVAIDARVQQNLGVRTAVVKRGTSAPSLQTVGTVAYNERDVAVVQARANGFVERLFVRAALDPVRAGQPLAELYVPDWVAAQEEFLVARRMAGRDHEGGLAGLADAARQRMRLAGMTEELIRAVESAGTVQARQTLRAPIGGVVGELNAREGMTVMSGAPLFRINGLSTVWINAEVPEAAAGQVRAGTLVEVQTMGATGAPLKGKVSALLPEVNAATRTLKARIEVPNRGQALVPGMFATLAFAPAGRKEVLLVPSEAVIQTGKRTVVIVAGDDGRFAPVDVDVGVDANGETEIRKGLEAGQKVVVSGQFLIDSEANLKAAINRMDAAPVPAGGVVTGSTTHHGEGKVESVDRDEVVISHGPIPSLSWGAMTMGFKLPAAGTARAVDVGDTVAFDIRPGKDGSYEIVSIARAPARPAVPGAKP
ncbi:MAG: efflux RND transporter periplasmic adaptor subunit [Casimicrobiaceae bacterium]